MAVSFCEQPTILAESNGPGRVDVPYIYFGFYRQHNDKSIPYIYNDNSTLHRDKSTRVVRKLLRHFPQIHSIKSCIYEISPYSKPEQRKQMNQFSISSPRYTTFATRENVSMETEQ